MKILSVTCLAAVLSASAGCRPFEAGLHEQAIANDGAKLLLDSVVTKKISVGDSVAHAKEVLAYAGLSYGFEKSEPELRSIYRTGKRSGFTIKITFDSLRVVTSVTVEPFFTGP